MVCDNVERNPIKIRRFIHTMDSILADNLCYLNDIEKELLVDVAATIVKMQLYTEIQHTWLESLKAQLLQRKRREGTTRGLVLKTDVVIKTNARSNNILRFRNVRS